MFILEDRVYFDGAAAADASEAKDNVAAADVNAESAATAGSSSADARAADAAEPTPDADASSSQSSEAGASASSLTGVDALIGAILNGDASIASGASGVDVMVVSSAADNASDLIAAAQDQNFTIVSYDPSTESLSDLLSDIQGSLDGASAASINFITADDGASGFTLVDGEATTIDSLSSESPFWNGVSDLLSDGGTIGISGDASLSSSGYSALETAIADTTGHEVSFIDASTGDATYAFADSQDASIYFIDSSVLDSGPILSAIPEGSIVVQLEAGQGIDAITDTISHYSNLDSVHIISQANYAQMLVGNDVITAANASGYQAEFASWSSHLAKDADILLYGCDMAKTAAGQSVVGQIATWTGADVAASTDITGNNGGNWTLEYAAGSIEAATLDVSDYNHHLETYVVTQTTDNGAGTTEGSLSWAITQSNSTTAVDDSIIFNLSSGDTVTVSAALPTITDSVSIDGTNLATGNNITLTVTTPGSSTYHLFTINVVSGETITISDMTIKGGECLRPRQHKRPDGDKRSRSLYREFRQHISHRCNPLKRQGLPRRRSQLQGQHHRDFDDDPLHHQRQHRHSPGRRHVSSWHSVYDELRRQRQHRQ